MIENSNIYKPEMSNKQIVAQRLSHSIKKYLKARLTHHCGFKNSPYEEWIKSIKKSDHIITYNYDWLIEALIKKHTNDSTDHLKNMTDELESWKTEKAPFSVLKVGILLKLHGSLNWYTCSNDHCPSSHLVFVADEGLYHQVVGGEPQIAYMPKKLTNCPNCSSPFDQVIIYPGMVKRYERFPKVGWVARLACQAGFIINALNRCVRSLVPP